MNALCRCERRLTLLLEIIVTALFFMVLSLTIALVILRYGFNSSIIGGSEAMEYLFIYTTALGAAVSVGKGDHISISYLIDKLRPGARRWVNLLNYLLIGFVNAVMIWYSPNWIHSAGYFESPVLRIPNWMVQVSVPIGCSLAILYCLNQIVLEISKPARTSETKVSP
jgi:TRAP-type C4-dicarboxylate transport system permease small subunit